MKRLTTPTYLARPWASTNSKTRPFIAKWCLLGTIAAIGLGACVDRATAPASLTGLKPHRFLDDANFGANNSSASGSYDGVIDTVYGGAAPLPTPVGVFPYPTIIQVNVSGSTSQVPRAVPGDNISHVPYYTPGNTGLFGVMGFPTGEGNGIWWAPTPSSIVKVQGELKPFLNWDGQQPLGDASHCGKGGYALCWSWAGSAHLDFTRIQVGLTVAPEAVHGVMDSSITFSAGMEQETVSGIPVDMRGLEWRWVPASDPSDTVTCSSSSGSSCTHVVRGPGVMHVSAYVNGEQQEKQGIVLMLEDKPRLQLAAMEYVLLAPGDTDSFDASATDQSTVIVHAWSFTPDSVGEPVVADTSTWGNCVAGMVSCTNFVPTSGTVKVIGTVAGSMQVAEAHVDVVSDTSGGGDCSTAHSRAGTFATRRQLQRSIIGRRALLRSCDDSTGSGGGDPEAPEISSIAPTPIVPGKSATIIGKHFNPVGDSNEVTIAGLPAKVTAGSATLLIVTVPCALSDTGVNVTVKNGTQTSAVFRHPLQANKVTLAIGQSRIFTGAAESSCNELPVAGDSARYILSIVNVDTVPARTLPMQMSANRLSPFGTAASKVVGSLPTASSRLPAPNAAGRLERRREQAHISQLARNAQAYQLLRTKGILRGRAAIPRVQRSLLLGDTLPLTRQFHVTTPGHSGACDQYWVVSAKRIYANGKVAIYEDEATLNAVKADSNPQMKSYYTQIGDQFNAELEPILRANFGDVLLRDATTDSNGVIIALFTPRVANYTNVDGFVTPCDFVRGDTTTRSVGGPYNAPAGSGSGNIGEYFYAMVPTNTTSGIGAGTVGGWFANVRSTFIHESKHLASIVARATRGAPNEDGWLDEGTARIAEEIWGRDIVDRRAWRGNTGFGSASNPVSIYCDIRLGVACGGPRRPANTMYGHFYTLATSLRAQGRYSAFGATSYDSLPGGTRGVYYAEAWALVRYTIDRYASSESAFLRSLTDNDDVGLENLTKRAGTTPAALLGGKALSMYGDDYPGVASPVQDIRFPSWNLREIYDALHTALPSSFPEVFPLAPVALSFGTVTTPSISIAGGGAVWYELSGPQTAAQLVRLGDGAGQTLANNLRLAIVRLP